ncbi:putative membrane protein [Campylobacter lari]|uniref:hypothetical protein n=1 Tax=Campylobacter lari TaxID=201 RepID=UPI003979D1C9
MSDKEIKLKLSYSEEVLKILVMILLSILIIYKVEILTFLGVDFYSFDKGYFDSIFVYINTYFLYLMFLIPHPDELPLVDDNTSFMNYCGIAIIFGFAVAFSSVVFCIGFLSMLKEELFEFFFGDLNNSFLLYILIGLIWADYLNNCIHMIKSAKVKA